MYTLFTICLSFYTFASMVGGMFDSRLVSGVKVMQLYVI